MEQEKVKYKTLVIDDVAYKTLYHTKYENVRSMSCQIQEFKIVLTRKYFESFGKGRCY